MKRLALVAAVLVVAACGKKDNSAMDTTSTPNAAMTDSGAGAQINAAANALDSTASAAADSIQNAAKTVDSIAKQH